jgi:esterase/lipase superfamily enzyme
MQLKPITAIIVLFLVVASLLVAGCTNPIQQVQNAVTPQNKAVDYANAFVNYTKNNNTDPNVTFTSVKVSENGTDQARISITSVNTTKNTSSLDQRRPTH